MRRVIVETRRWQVDLTKDAEWSEDAIIEAFDEGTLPGTLLDSPSFELEPLTPAERVTASAEAQERGKQEPLE